ncbi:MAG: RluA family pseudouridine synthase [Bacilli bacterium]|nr:RluA family pseudouridine synthase [Bacilli bacterium]
MNLKSCTSDIRVDKFLSIETDYSRETITKMINEGFIKVNGKMIKPSYKIKVDDEVTIDESYIQDTSVEAVEMPLNIVYEDDDILVINKPSGLVVHPGNGNYNNTLVNGLMYYTQNLSDIGDTSRPGIVHRLDKDTSGLMLVAKSNKAHEVLADDFKNKRVHREYIALLEGVLPTNQAFVDAPIGRSKENFQKMTVMQGGKSARTHVTVLQKFPQYTLVKLVLETGRTHQIRVHMAYIGHPVVNDPVYGKKEATEFGQFLHSAYLKFTHPITHEILEFSCEMPHEMQEFLDALQK